MYEKYKHLKIERKNKILTITIDNPPMNAVNRGIHGELATIFPEINHDPDTAVVVVTGGGEKAFSAGGDIDAMAERIEKGLHERWIRTVWEGRQITMGILDLERPLIARVNGHAMGLGASLAALSDFSFMLETARIADTHVKVGLAAGDGGAFLWPLLMGFANARRYLMTGDMMTGKEAAELGLIGASVPDMATLDAEVDAMAQRLLEGAPLAINATKICINKTLRALIENVVDDHVGQETFTYLSKDHYEAVSAFREKRKPEFRGE